MTPVVLTVFGMPRTKKTSSVMAKTGDRRTGRPVLLPAKEWVQWTKDALILQQADLFAETIGRPGDKVFLGLTPLVSERVNCRAWFFVKRSQHGDAVGYYQGLADLLQKRGVLENDRLIGAWDGSDLFVDEIRPRVEIVLTERPKRDTPPPTGPF